VATEQALGLRDRKKIKTRDAIHREAMRLIQTNGYANTTIEQIAEAAEVSPSTFIRYFPTKEMALITNDLDQMTVDALSQLPGTCRRCRPFGAPWRSHWRSSRRTSGNSNATPTTSRSESSSARWRVA
jgi:AcrR family transcriptional regulator